MLPVPGQRVTHWPPYSRVATHSSTSLAIGLTGLRLGAVEKVPVAEEEPLAGAHFSVLCACQQGGACPTIGAPHPRQPGPRSPP